MGKCEDCKWWDNPKVVDVADKGFGLTTPFGSLTDCKAINGKDIFGGECHRYPPSRQVGNYGGLGYKGTFADDYCGEFEAK